jgi:hypothetical protein
MQLPSHISRIGGKIISLFLKHKSDAPHLCPENTGPGLPIHPSPAWRAGQWTNVKKGRP